MQKQSVGDPSDRRRVIPEGETQKNRVRGRQEPHQFSSFRIIGMQREGQRRLAFRSAEPLFLDAGSEIIQQLAFFLAFDRYLKIF